jgi:hypothetical protein
MKHLNVKAMILTVLMSMVGAKAMAADVKIYDAKINGLYYRFSGTEAEVVTELDNGYNEPPSARNIVIPSSVTYNGNTYTVTSIGDWVFAYNESVRSISIPNTVVSIGECAFFYAEKLSSIHIPKSVKAIGKGAFAGDIKNLTVDPENTVFDSRDNCNAVIETATNTLVSACNNTVVPSGVTTIGSDAFYRVSVHSNIIPYGVVTLAARAFSECHSTDNTIILPNSIKTIGNGAFYGCLWLRSITIPSSVESIGGYAFMVCNGLSSITFDNCCPVFSRTNPLEAIIDEDYTKDVYYPAYAHSYYSYGYMLRCNLHPQIKIDREWTTYCATASFEVPEGIDAYVVKSYSDGVVTLKKVTTINKGQGLLLKPASVGTFYDATLCASTPGAYETNLLRGVTSATDITATDGEYTNFIFTKVDDEIGFYPAKAGTIPAYKAYLQIPTASLPVGAPARLSVVFEDGETTSITPVRNNQKTSDEWYTLGGQRSTKPTERGIYIHEGKKVIIK